MARRFYLADTAADAEISGLSLPPTGWGDGLHRRRRTKGDDAAKFSINSSSGALSFVDAPDFENPTDADTNNTYVVIVGASDGTDMDTQTLNVTVTDVEGGSFLGGNYMWSPIRTIFER